MKATKQKGFSLIELLIVVTIIGIIASIAIPNLFASRRAANEASAISTLRVVNGGQIAYQATRGAGDFADFNQLRTQGIVDPVLGGGTNEKSGYRFTLAVTLRTPTTSGYYNLTATPQNATGILATTGSRIFFTLETHVIYFSPLAAGAPTAGPSRTVVGGAPIVIY